MSQKYGILEITDISLSDLVFRLPRTCVRKLRSYQPSFQGITKEDIIEQFPDLTPDDVEFLV